jgi:hypothetical protein
VISIARLWSFLAMIALAHLKIPSLSAMEMVPREFVSNFERIASLIHFDFSLEGIFSSDNLRAK